MPLELRRQLLSDRAWTTRILTRVAESAGPVAVVASRSDGANHIASAVVEHASDAVWIRFLPEDCGDRISQGNRVADALETAYGASIVGRGLPVEYTMRAAAELQRSLGPAVFVFTDVEYGAEACREVPRLHGAGAEVLLLGANLEAVSLAQPNTVVCTEDVLLTQRDLAALRAGAYQGLGMATLEQLSAEAGRRYLEVLVRVHEHLGLPPVLVPEPGGVSLAGADTGLVDHGQLVRALLARGQPASAFEVAVRSHQTLTADLVARGAQQLAEQGLYERLYGLVGLVGASKRKASPELVKWYFVAATATNRHHLVKAEVAAYLEECSHPELAALFAAAFPGADLSEVTAKALAELETPLTMRIHAFALAQQAPGEDAAELLMGAMRKADALGYRSQVMACATDLADFWLKRGRYGEAYEWSRWASQYFEQHGLRDGIRALVSLSLGAYVRMLTGDLIGLDDTCNRLDTSLSGVPTVETLVSTKADWLFLSGEFSAAAELYRVNVASASFGQFAVAAVDLVHALVHAGEVTDAEAVSQRAVAVSRGAGVVATGVAALSRGLALLARRDPEALEHLVTAQDALVEGFEAHKLAQASIALGRHWLHQGEPAAAATALRRGAIGLNELAPSGWKLLGGFFPEVETLRRLFSGANGSLEMAFLGGGEVVLGEELLDLGLRHKEVLAVLALNPAGLSAEQLGAKVYGDNYNFSSLKATVSKLRRLVHISSKPYAISHSFSADFLVVQELIAEGRIREALSYYRGELLPGSRAPEIVEWRLHLEELMRAAVLRENDADLLLRLATIIKGDLELVERAMAVLPPHDLRRTHVRALLARVQHAWSQD